MVLMTRLHFHVGWRKDAVAPFRASSQKQLIPSPGCRAGFPPGFVQQTMVGCNTSNCTAWEHCTSTDLPMQAEKGLCYLTIFIHPAVNSSNKCGMDFVHFADTDFLVTLNFNYFLKKELVADLLFILSSRTSCELFSCELL